MADTDRTFRCVVISPSGRLLDCQVTSVIFPAHDGQVGILYNHMPMFCKLGLGIMEVKTQQEDNLRLLIDGGFALIGSNLLRIIASVAISGRALEKEKIEQILEKSAKKLAGGTFTPEQRRHELQKNALLARL
jgi:F-type H+-transporting ATPase subunit epsilon